MAWNIYCDNQTDQPISFVLFQENEILDEDSYSVVWYKDMVGVGEKKGPIVLPSDISVSVHPEDKAHQQIAPTRFGRGDLWTYDSANNKITNTSNDEDDPSAYLENPKTNDVTVDVSVWKANTKIYTQKKVAPGDKLTIGLSAKVFVAVDNSLNVGDTFQVLTLEQSPTAYELESSEVNIVAKKENGKIVFSN